MLDAVEGDISAVPASAASALPASNLLGLSATVGLGLTSNLRPSLDGSEFDRASTISEHAIWDFPLPPSTSTNAIPHHAELDDEEEDVLSAIASTPSRSSAASMSSLPQSGSITREPATQSADSSVPNRDSTLARPAHLGRSESADHVLHRGLHLGRRHSLLPHPHLPRLPKQTAAKEGSTAGAQEARHRKLTSLLTTLGLARTRFSAQRGTREQAESTQRTPLYTLRKRSAPEAELVLGAHSASQLAPKLASHLGVSTSSSEASQSAAPVQWPLPPEELTAGAKAAQLLGLDEARSLQTSGTPSVACSDASGPDGLPNFPGRQETVLEKAITLADLYKYTFTASTMLRAGKATFKRRFIVLARSNSGAESAPSHQYTLHAFRTANPAEPESARLRLLPSSKLSIPCLQDYNNIGEGKSRLPYAILLTGKGAFRAGRGIAAHERDTSWILGTEDQDTHTSWLDVLREIVRELIAARSDRIDHVADKDVVTATQRVSDVAEARAEATGWRAGMLDAFEQDSQSPRSGFVAPSASLARDLQTTLTLRREATDNLPDGTSRGSLAEQPSSDDEPIDPIFAIVNAVPIVRHPAVSLSDGTAEQPGHGRKISHSPSAPRLGQCRDPCERSMRTGLPPPSGSSRHSAGTSFSGSSPPSLVSTSSSSFYSSRRSSGHSTGSGPFSLFPDPPSPPPKGALPPIPLSPDIAYTR